MFFGDYYVSNVLRLRQKFNKKITNINREYINVVKYHSIVHSFFKIIKKSLSVFASMPSEEFSYKMIDNKPHISKLGQKVEQTLYFL